MTADTRPSLSSEDLDREVAELQQILDRLDGLTHDARRKLRLLQEHHSGVDPRWTAKHR